MQGIVLVGGEGTRLRPLTYDMPKPMLPIVERPIIARVVEWLGLHGVDRVVLSIGYQPDPFLAAFPARRGRGWRSATPLNRTPWTPPGRSASPPRRRG